MPNFGHDCSAGYRSHGVLSDYSLEDEEALIFSIQIPIRLSSHLNHGVMPLRHYLLEVTSVRQ